MIELGKKRGQYGGGQASYESVIPLILILILAIFIAGKFGILNLSSLPVVGSLFGAPYIKVLVIGTPSAQLEQMLQAEDFRVAGITYAGSIRQETIYPGTLDNFDIVILDNTRTCDRTVRKVVADKVKAGGKLIVIADACTTVNDDPNAVGWDIGIGTLGDVMPVKYGGILFHEPTGTTTSTVSGKFKAIAFDNPIFNGLKNFQFSGPVTKVYPNPNSNVLAYIDNWGNRVTSPADFAIIESKGLLTGKVIYFSFYPDTTSRNMLRNTLLYVKGAKG